MLLAGCSSGGGTASPPVSPQSAGAPRTAPQSISAHNLVPMSYYPQHTAIERAEFERTTAIPLWTSAKFKAEGGTWSYTMMGTEPKGGKSTTIPVIVVPTAFKFSDGTVLDPSKDVACNDPGKQTVSKRFAASPLFNDYAYPSGDKTQYEDEFQKTNFWKVGGSQSGYHVLYKYTTAPKQTFTVPASAGTTQSAGTCGNKIGEIDINWFANNVEPAILKAGSNASISYGLTYNLFLTEGGGCCIIGYHDYSGGQVFGYGSYVDPGVFSVPIEDTSAIAHEFGEALDDPEINNATPVWGGGQVPACGQNNLEVGDPLTGTNYPDIPLKGFSYHLQELTYWAWFFDKPTTAYHAGWWSNNGTFTNYATPC